MSGIENFKETNILTPDIRSKIDKIEDVEIKNDILDHLKSLELQEADKASIVLELQTENARLLKKNSELFMRVDAFNSKEKPDITTDYSNMNRDDLTEIINKVAKNGN